MAAPAAEFTHGRPLEAGAAEQIRISASVSISRSKINPRMHIDRSASMPIFMILLSAYTDTLLLYARTASTWR